MFQNVWWQLPSIKNFISEVVQDLSDGKNIIFCLPEYFPDGLRSAIRFELDEDWDWQVISVQNEHDYSPIHLLFDKFIYDIEPQTLRNTVTLANHQDFAGKIIWVKDLTSKEWKKWQSFLIEYEQCCRAISPIYRTLFCVSLEGELALNPPVEDVCLAVYQWSGIVENLDMLIFTSHLLKRKPIPPLQKKIATSMITNLALWDAEISERLAAETIERIFNPFPVLKDIAQERNWHFNTKDNSRQLWAKGMRDSIDGQEQFHSAILLLDRNYKAEIEKRIWSAQVGVMFPFIEERRQEIIHKLTKFKVLRVPFETSFGRVITDLKDLEIGHIYTQIDHNHNTYLSRPLKFFITKLKNIRNSLSHLEPIEPEILLSSEVNNWDDIVN